MKHKAKHILVVMLTVMIIFGYLTPLVADEANAATADLDLCDLGCELEHCDGDHCDGGHYDEENCDWGHCDEEICDGVICDGDNCDGGCYSEHCGDCECENGHCDEQCDSIGVVEVSSSSSVGRMTKEQAACSHVWNISAATCTVQKWCKKCGYVAQKALGHSTVYKETKAATCTTQGTYVYTCTRSGCGYSTGGYIPSLGHKAGAAATCTSAQKCTRCNVVLNNALGHKGGAAATCTTAQKCTRCGVTLKNALGHSAGAAATCTTAQKCTRCGVTLKNALGHDAPYKQTKAPTCTTQGEYVYKCTRCSYSTGGYIPALGHSAGAAATCTAPQKCTRCSTVINNALGHAWDNGTVTKAATCTATGTKTFKCSRCGGTKTETINALGHSAGAAATCTAPQKCTRCNATLKNALGHAWDNGTVTKAATCTATGTKTFKCTRCATTKTESIPVIAHSYTWKVTTNPTCTKEGVESYKCSCGNVSQTRAVAKIAHNCEWKVTVQASCKGAGKEEYICKVCGAVTNGRSIQYYGGHTWDRTAATCTAAQKCTVCGTIGQEALGHAWDNGTVTKGASHSATGVKTFKCTRTGCTATKTETIPVIAHSYTWVVTTPSTCTKEGVESYKCGCGDVSQTRSVAKKAHNGVWATTVQPSCAGSGTEECTCKDCGVWLGARSIQYYGDHTWDRAAADCTHDKKCTVCGLVDQKAPGHTYTSEATCTKDKKCDVCGYVAKKALGHNYQTETTKEPTCTEQGVYVSKCTRCGDIAKDGNGYIGVTGHTWDIDASAVTCTRGQKCIVCGAEGVSKKNHNPEWKTVQNSQGKDIVKSVCSVCGVTIGEVTDFDLPRVGGLPDFALASVNFELDDFAILYVTPREGQDGYEAVVGRRLPYIVGIAALDYLVPVGYTLIGYIPNILRPDVIVQPNEVSIAPGSIVVAVLKKKDYTITLCDNTGDAQNPGSVYAVTKQHLGDEIELPSCMDSFNSVFMGYATNREAEQAEYGMVRSIPTEDPVKVLYTVSGNATLFAVWHHHTWDRDGATYYCDQICTTCGAVGEKAGDSWVIGYDARGLSWECKRNGKVMWERDTEEETSWDYIVLETSSGMVKYEVSGMPYWLHIRRQDNADGACRLWFSCDPYLSIDESLPKRRVADIVFSVEGGDPVYLTVRQYRPIGLYHNFCFLQNSEEFYASEYETFRNKLGNDTVTMNQYYGFDNSNLKTAVADNGDYFLLHREYTLSRIVDTTKMSPTKDNYKNLYLSVDVSYIRVAVRETTLSVVKPIPGKEKRIILKEIDRKGAGGITDMSYVLYDELNNACFVDYGIKYDRREYFQGNFKDSLITVGLNVGGLAIDYWSLHDGGTVSGVVGVLYGTLETGVAISQQDKRGTVDSYLGTIYGIADTGKLVPENLSYVATAADMGHRTGVIIGTLASMRGAHYGNVGVNVGGECDEEGVISGETIESHRLNMTNGTEIYVYYTDDVATNHEWHKEIMITFYGDEYRIR